MLGINDSIWSIVGVLATICFGLVGLVGVVFTFMQLIQTRKGLSYEIQSIAPVFTITKGLLEQLEIRLNNEIVRNAYLIVLRIANTGKTSIKPDDFVQPLKLSLDDGNIISASISNSIPSELENAIQSADKVSIVFNRILLNSGDEFTVQLLVSEIQSAEPRFRIEGRIDGVNSITKMIKEDSKDAKNQTKFTTKDYVLAYGALPMLLGLGISIGLLLSQIQFP